MRRLGARLGRFLRDPIGYGRRIWSRKAYSLFRFAQLVPERPRSLVARPVAAIAQRYAERPGRHRISPQLAFVARWATGDTSGAGRLARNLVTADRTTVGARRRLAQLTMAAGLSADARGLVDADPGDRAPILEAVRSRLDYEAGAYQSALDHARAAGTAHEARGLAETAESRIRSLQPAWDPPLGRVGPRLARVRGQAVKGRIVHLVFASLPYHQSGYCVRSQAVGRCQLDAGLDPHFVTRAGFPGNQGIDRSPREEVINGVPYHHISPQFRTEGRTERTIAETIRGAAPLLERLRPAAVQPATNHVQAQIALALARPMGIPVVYEVRGFWEETWASHPWHDEAEAVTTDHYRMTRALETHLMLQADAVVTLSETMRDAIVDRGIARDRIVVVPNAVELARFEPIPRDEALAAQLGIEPGEAIVGYISTLNAYEGIEYLLDAAARLRAAGRRVRVLLVGDGSHRPAIEARAHELGLDDGTLIMAGRVAHEAVPSYYSLLDVFVVPRTGDRVSRLVTPLKPFEAMAMERPVLVSDVPALREIVEHDRTGATFRAEDPEDLARVLAELLDDPGRRSRLGRQAREWVVENRTWRANGRRYRELYEALGAA